RSLLSRLLGGGDPGERAHQPRLAPRGVVRMQDALLRGLVQGTDRVSHFLTGEAGGAVDGAASTRDQRLYRGPRGAVSIALPHRCTHALLGRSGVCHATADFPDKYPTSTLPLRGRERLQNGTRP